MKIIIGLGNPGAEYHASRHNLGFDILDALAKEAQVKFRRSWRQKSHIATIKTELGPILLAKPQTFMNNSGLAVKALIKKHRVPVSDLLIVFDDLDLDCGDIRIRQQGSSGGHNGLNSIEAHLGTQKFARLRVGIGPRPSGDELVDYVLGSWDENQRKPLEESIKESMDAIHYYASHRIEECMSQFNGRRV